MAGAVQYDAGRPYVLHPQTGARVYISPVAMGQERPAEASEGAWRDFRWNPTKGEYERPFKLGKAITAGTIAALTAGAANAGAFSWLGGGGGGVPGAFSSSVAPSVGGTTAMTAVPAAVTAGGGGAKVGFFSTLGKWLSTPAGQVLSSTAGDLVGAGMRQRGANRAIDAQAQAAREALAFEREVYGDAKQRAAPWDAMTPQVTATLGEILGRPRQTATAGGVFGAGDLASGGQPATLAQLKSAGSGQTPAATAQSPQVGERRLINGQVGMWDGRGWKAVAA